MKLDLLPGLRRMPLDGGRTFRGKRLFGDNKTWRGAVVTIGTTTLAAWALAQLSACCWPLPTLVPFAETHPVVWGLLLGTGYIVGELPNSFAKRQLGISPGAAGHAGPRAGCSGWSTSSTASPGCWSSSRRCGARRSRCSRASWL